jgi:hypothetical protein
MTPMAYSKVPFIICNGANQFVTNIDMRYHYHSMNSGTAILNEILYTFTFFT